MAWGDLTANQFVSRADAASSPFTKKNGFAPVSTDPTYNMFLTKSEALYYLDIVTANLGSLNDFQFPWKGLFASAARPTAWRAAYPFCINESQFTFDMDFLVITYEFTSPGRDLDMRTRITSPNIGQNAQTDYVGWGRNSAFPTTGIPIITWGGDNTGVGFESVLIDLNRLRALYGTGTPLVVDLRGFWYGQFNATPINVAGVLYRGGTMTKQLDTGAGFGFVCTSPTEAITVDFVSKPVGTYTQNAATSGDRIATLTYDLVTKHGILINNDTTTPEI